MAEGTHPAPPRRLTALRNGLILFYVALAIAFFIWWRAEMGEKQDLSVFLLVIAGVFVLGGIVLAYLASLVAVLLGQLLRLPVWIIAVIAIAAGPIALIAISALLV